MNPFEPPVPELVNKSKLIEEFNSVQTKNLRNTCVEAPEEILTKNVEIIGKAGGLSGVSSRKTSLAVDKLGEQLVGEQLVREQLVGEQLVGGKGEKLVGEKLVGEKEEKGEKDYEMRSEKFFTSQALNNATSTTISQVSVSVCSTFLPCRRVCLPTFR